MRVSQGFALAAVIGVPMGLLIGWSRPFSQLVDPMVQSLRPIPITAWLPFSIALFGIRDIGSVFLIFLGGFYAIVVNTTQGARDVERNWVRAALMMGANRQQLLEEVLLKDYLEEMCLYMVNKSVFQYLEVGILLVFHQRYVFLLL